MTESPAPRPPGPRSGVREDGFPEQDPLHGPLEVLAQPWGRKPEVVEGVTVPLAVERLPVSSKP